MLCFSHQQQIKFVQPTFCQSHTNQEENVRRNKGSLLNCVNPEYVLLAKCSNCMFACACANCQTPDATVIFALQLPPPSLPPSLPIALLFIPDYRLAEGLSNRIPHNQSQDFSTTSSHNSSERSGSLSGWCTLQRTVSKGNWEALWGSAARLCDR